MSFLLTGCFNQKEEKKESKEIEKTEVQEESFEVILSEEKSTNKNTSHMEELYQKLEEYGDKIYQTEDYKSFPKSNNMPFISLKELEEKYHYDIQMFKGDDGTVCDVEHSGIFFDTDHFQKVEYEDDFYPILPSLVGCSKSQLTN